MISNCTASLRESHLTAGFQRPSRDKVKKIAIEILKALAVVLVGAALGALTLASSGMIWLIVGVAAGGLVGGVAYGALRTYLHKVKKNGYPALNFRTEAPKPLAYWSKKKQDKKLSNYFDKDLAKEPLFQEWKNLKNIKSNNSAKRHLRKRMRQNGVCAGEAIALATERALSSVDQKMKAKARDVFRIQIAECMRADFEGKGKSANADKAFEERQQGLNNAQLAEVDLQNLNQQIPQGEAYGIIRLEAAKKAHFLYFECIGTSGRFYDPASRHAGWHENFANRDELIESLQNHLKAGMQGKKIYRSQYTRGLLYAYNK
jgi:hypothetical protein